MSKKNALMDTQLRSTYIPPSAIHEADRTIEVVVQPKAKGEGWSYVKEIKASKAPIDITRLQNGTPFFESHASWRMDAVVDSVKDTTVANGRGRSRNRLLKGVEVTEKILKKVKQMIISADSISYYVKKYGEEIIYRIRHLKDVTWTALAWSTVAVAADVSVSVLKGEKKPESLLESQKSREKLNIRKNLKKAREAEIKETVTTEKEKSQALLADTQEEINEIQAAVAVEQLLPELTKTDEGSEGGGSADDAAKKADEEATSTKRAAENIDICALAGFNAKATCSFMKQGKSTKKSAEKLSTSLLIALKKAQPFYTSPSPEKTQSLTDILLLKTKSKERLKCVN